MENQQTDIWNGDAGDTWVRMKAILDEMFRPFEHMLAEAIPPHSNLPVLDVGCGTGSTTLALARRLSAQGSCLGADISAPMIGAARENNDSPNADFLCCDVQRHAFAPASFDVIVSRFGVMFFDDPVAAFANLHSAARHGAELRFFAWRAAQENPFMTAAEQAVPALIDPEPSQPDAPGQFAFARRERVQDILAASGWKKISVEPIDVVCSLALSDVHVYASCMGKVGRALQDLAPAERFEMIERVAAAFKQFEHAGVIRYTAACWDVRAYA